MKKKVALLLVLLSSLAMAQQNALVIQQTFSAATTYPVSTGLPVAGYTNHTLTWSQVGSTTITGCLVQVDSSPTGTGSWTAAGVIASQACNSSGTITITSSTASYIRINVTAITAGTVKVTYSAVNGALAMNSAVNITGTAAGITGYSIGTAPGNILTNPCFSAYQLPYEGPTGLTCLTGPAGPDGVAQVPCIQSSGGLPTAYTLCMASVVEDATNPATLPVTDRGKLVYWTGGAAFALPPVSQVPATGTGLSLHFPFFNDTATAVVVTPNVGVNDLCNGAVTCTVPPYHYAEYSQDTTSGPGHWHMEALVTSAALGLTNNNTWTGINTYAGVVTGALSSSLVAQDTNSTNSNTSIGLISNCAGTSVGCIGLVSNSVSGTVAGGGDLFQGYSGSTITSGVLSGGTLEAKIRADGAGLFGASAPAPTLGTAGGAVATEGTAFTGTSTQYGWYNDSTLHCFGVIDQTTNIGCAVGEAAIIAANVLPKATGTTAGQIASSITDNGTIVSASEPYASATFEGTATNTAVTVQAGIDANTTGATAALLAKGEDVAGGSTASMAGGAITVRGGNNASSGATQTAGAVTIQGGDTTNASAAVQTTGAVTIRGGNNTATGAGGTLGPVSITGGTQSGAATNGGAGGNVTISGGLTTGNTQPAHVILKTPGMVPTSGSTAEVQATNYVVHKKLGSTTSAVATTMFNMTVAANQTIGAEIIVHVETTQATPHNCSSIERFMVAVQNTGGTVTSQIISESPSIATICDTGSLTMTLTNTAATPSVFSVTPSWVTVVPVSVIITVEIHNLSQQDIALL